MSDTYTVNLDARVPNADDTMDEAVFTTSYGDLLAQEEATLKKWDKWDKGPSFERTTFTLFLALEHVLDETEREAVWRFAASVAAFMDGIEEHLNRREDGERSHDAA